MNFLLNIVVKIISDLGYLGVMFASLIESACIPLPSEIIFPFSGYLIYLGKFTFWGVMFYGMLGQILGSVITYWIGSLGALPVLEKYGKYLLIKKEDIVKAQKWFSKYGEGAVFWGRMLPVIRTFISLPAGIAKMNFWKFLIYTLIGCIPWLYFLTYSGYYLGNNWVEIKLLFHKYELILLGLLILGLALYLIKQNFLFKKKLGNLEID